MLVGIWKEGVRVAQLPFIFAFFLYWVTFGITGYFLYWLLVGGYAVSVTLWFKYGEGDYSKFRPSGTYRVGFRNFRTKEFGNFCSIFYPAANDNSGKFEVPFWPFGENNLKSFQNIVNQ
jgi:hypothetical protein